MTTWWRSFTSTSGPVVQKSAHFLNYFRNFENCPNGSAELAVKSFVCPDTFTRIWSIRLIFINSYLIGIILFQALASFHRCFSLEGLNRNTLDLEMSHCIAHLLNPRDSHKIFCEKFYEMPWDSRAT